MAIIHVLDSATIDKIAAGEVVERPVSVVKELVENAIDAGATHIAVEVKEGGISLIRVTDDGCGIEHGQLERAFFRHATSKIEDAEDLNAITSLGFRGEALSSIAAVSQVELITKTAEELIGSRICISGGIQEEITEVGAPGGTTILVRNLFYNTPARKKFLKSPATEGSYINEYMQHLALAAPKVAFQFVLNGQTKFYTSGNGDVKEILYRIYGKEVANQLLPYEASMDGAVIRGYLGKPVLARANRSFEILFVNGRFIKSALLSSAIEEGYRTLLMQHKFPFAVLHFSIDPARLDVNVHPTKLDIRISDPGELLKLLADTIAGTLTGGSLIQPSVVKGEDMTREEKAAEKAEEIRKQKELTAAIPQPFEERRMAREQSLYAAPEGEGEQSLYEAPEDDKSLRESPEQESRLPKLLGAAMEQRSDRIERSNVIKQKDVVIVERPKQMELFDEIDVRELQIDQFEIVGQVFDTYWILTMGDKLYYVDQHAAHEKVMYEKLMARYRNKDIFAQPLNPPIILQLSPREAETLSRNRQSFLALGFETEEFGQDSFALRSVPMDLYGSSEKELFLSALDAIMDEGPGKDPDAILMKIASMSCKAAVKGNMKMSLQEARALFTEMFRCDNPYHCPHGRPTMISLSKSEMEKKFHR
ncbi:MAG: DNA mismatch repair endonuclease MutL [Lachnospiraceae bacterium]|nr:DNA mismatch repair endonuclease MutL [Lachnospiraceae bacterium]